MPKLSLVKGTTSYRAYVFLGDSSVSTGAGKTGLAFNTSGLKAYYVRPGGSATQITLATQTVTGAYSSGGFVEVDATNMPGIYRLDVPDAALATGANAVVVMLSGAANMAPCVLEIELTAVNNQDAAAFGLGNLDATVSSRSTYAGADTSGTTTLLSRLTNTRATNLDSLDATVSSRLAGASYTAPPTANQNADALLDRTDGVETSYTPRQALRLILAALAGKLSGAATTTVTIRNVGDSKNRITATVDADGNRSGVSYDVS